MLFVRYLNLTGEVNMRGRSLFSERTQKLEHVAWPAGDNLVEQAYQLLRHIPGRTSDSVQKGTCKKVLEGWKNKTPEQILGKYVNDLQTCKQLLRDDRGYAITLKEYYPKEDYAHVIEIYNLLDNTYENYVAARNNSQKPEDNQDQQHCSCNP
ncbi:hypothetical protein Lnau_1793 [Legionella nautarum]|uniref:Uncharacterized protein n=2 Tax=Legionella nautarum TaxID=45070 RepID=A0A0W0WWV2_9GAMM|nr:hypothetical protein Lnau_1793 [Legionella nautarum]